jgi:hypothetical protein
MRKHIKHQQKEKMLCRDGGRYDEGEQKVCESKSAVATDRDDFGVWVGACVRACVGTWVFVLQAERDWLLQTKEQGQGCCYCPSVCTATLRVFVNTHTHTHTHTHTEHIHILRGR